MFAPFVRLALAKSGASAEREIVARLLAIADELDAAESSFESRINANKAARGEGPTKVSAAKRVELKELAADARELEARQLVEFEAMDSAAEIIFGLHMGLGSDVACWQQAHRYAHPEDAAIVREFADAKAALRDAMAQFLQRYPANVD